MTLTQKRLKELLHYDSETGMFTWKVDGRGRITKDNIAGTDNGRGYIQITIDGTKYRANRLAWLYEYGYLPENIVDHINRIRDDNRIKNLREVSCQCNIRNTDNRKDNTSGVKGVYWHKQRDCWNARIAVNGKNKSLGLFNNFTEAVAHRLAAEQCLNWAGCDSNSPAYQYITGYLRELDNES